MKKDYFVEMEIPENIKAEIRGRALHLEKEGNKISREAGNLNIKISGNKLVIDEKNADKRKKKLINTFESHVKNMINGLEKKYVYKVQVCFVHFPSTVEIKDKEILIKNFLGEITPRKAKIANDVKVKKEGDILVIESHNKDSAGQTAANIEKATKIKARDRRIFQDGAYIIEKPGRGI